jgi:hypothetical protein
MSSRRNFLLLEIFASISGEMGSILSGVECASSPTMEVQRGRTYCVSAAAYYVTSMAQNGDYATSRTSCSQLSSPTSPWSSWCHCSLTFPRDTIVVPLPHRYYVFQPPPVLSVHWSIISESAMAWLLDASQASCCPWIFQWAVLPCAFPSCSEITRKNLQ